MGKQKKVEMLVTEFMNGLVANLKEKNMIQNWSLSFKRGEVVLNLDLLQSIGERSVYMNKRLNHDFYSYWVYPNVYQIPELGLRKEKASINLSSFEIINSGNGFVSIGGVPRSIIIQREEVPSRWPKDLMRDNAEETYFLAQLWDILFQDSNFGVSWAIDILSQLKEAILALLNDSENYSEEPKISDALSELRKLLD